MNILNKKIDILLPKVKKDRQTQPLRDPIDKNLFTIFMANAGSSFQKKRFKMGSNSNFIHNTLSLWCTD